MILLSVLTCLLSILYVFSNKQNDELVFKHLEEQYKENILSHPLVGKTTIYTYTFNHLCISFIRMSCNLIELLVSNYINLGNLYRENNKHQVQLYILFFLFLSFLHVLNK